MTPAQYQDYDVSADHQSAQVIQIDSGKHVYLVAICAAMCGVAVAVSVWAAFAARDAETEARLVEYYLLDPHYRTPDELSAWARFHKEHQ
jgi:hypothetical protein